MENTTEISSTVLTEVNNTMKTIGSEAPEEPVPWWWFAPISLLSIAFCVTLIVIFIQYYARKTLLRKQKVLEEKLKELKAENKTEGQMNLIQGTVKSLGKTEEKSISKEKSSEINEHEDSSILKMDSISFEKRTKEPKEDIQGENDEDMEILLSAISFLCSKDENSINKKDEEFPDVPPFGSSPVSEILRSLKTFLSLKRIKEEEMEKTSLDLFFSFIETPLAEWESNPGMAEIEASMINRMGRKINLPKDFLINEWKGNGGGCFVKSSREALLLSSFAARSKILNNNENSTGNLMETMGRLTVYCQKEVMENVAEICKMMTMEVRVLERLAKEEMEKIMKEDAENGFIPCLLILKNIEKARDFIGGRLNWLHFDLDDVDKLSETEKEMIKSADSLSANVCGRKMIWTKDKRMFCAHFQMNSVEKNGYNPIEWSIHDRKKATGLRLYAELLGKKLAEE